MVTKRMRRILDTIPPEYREKTIDQIRYGSPNYERAVLRSLWAQVFTADMTPEERLSYNINGIFALFFREKRKEARK